MILNVFCRSVAGALANELKTVKFLAFLVGIMAVLLVSPSIARADEVFIAGFTNGCFGVGCAPGASASIPGLNFSNSTFSGTTANGFRGLGGNANPGANVNNLGSFSLSTAPNTFNQTFTLQVTFTAPQGFSGSNVANFTATVTGTVRAADDGGVFIDFNNNPVVFNFNDTNCGATTVPGQQTTCGIGSFSFSINDIAIDPGQTSAITGQITLAQQSLTPTAATVSISGHVTSALGRGITGIQLSLTDSEGNTKTATTATGGYYRFEDVQVGETYILSATGKRFTFNQPVQVLSVNEETNEVNFIANAEKRLRSF